MFHWEVSTEKTGLPFQNFRLFRKISSGPNQKVMFYFHPKRNFRNFLVNGKRPLFVVRSDYNFFPLVWNVYHSLIFSNIFFSAFLKCPMGSWLM